MMRADGFLIDSVGSTDFNRSDQLNSEDASVSKMHAIIQEFREMERVGAMRECSDDTCVMENLAAIRDFREKESVSALREESLLKN